MQDTIFHPDVRIEIQQSFNWYNEHSKGLGEEFLKELDNAIGFISDNPLMWALYSKGYRKYLLKRFPFAVIYKPEKDTIYVVAVMHLSRKPGYWEKRI